MTSELGLNLHCSNNEAHYHLTNLSPYEMKQLVHNILSGKEFELVKSGTSYSYIHYSSYLSKESSNVFVSNPYFKKTLLKCQRRLALKL